MDDLLYLLWFVQTFGAGNAKISKILSLYESITDAYLAVTGGYALGSQIISESEQRAAAASSVDRCRQIIDYCARKNIRLIPKYSKEYPEPLRNIYNPPVLLFCRGKTEILSDEMAVTIVGTRHPSDYSKKVCERFAAELAKCGFTIASGFAVGIDITSHLAAVRAGGKTISVLGCGLDVDYPEPNIKYRSEIMENGVFVSEKLPLEEGSRTSFPQRNRILSGLSLGTLIIEGAASSGSLVTANLAAQQGKDVFCIPPHDILSSAYTGNVILMRDGAKAVCRPSDIVDEYCGAFSDRLAHVEYTGRHSPFYNVMNADEDVSDIPEKNRNSEASDNAYADAPKPERPAEMPDVSGIEEKQAEIVRFLFKNGPTAADDIADALDEDVSQLFMALTELEIMGILRQSAGQHYEVI